MKPAQRPSKPKADPQPRTNERSEGTNARQRRPDPRAEPIPDGEHKYVPRSPYRTGNY
ncbi:MAG: hypothetical protein HY854_22790 [Burkholderiales bacterium]|nr:hypothetical protein [Burkholderiales bacterium]